MSVRIKAREDTSRRSLSRPVHMHLLTDCCRKMYLLDNGKITMGITWYSNIIDHSIYDDKFITRVSLGEITMSVTENGETYSFLAPTCHCIHFCSSMDLDVIEYCGINFIPQYSIMFRSILEQEWILSVLVHGRYLDLLSDKFRMSSNFKSSLGSLRTTWKYYMLFKLLWQYLSYADLSQKIWMNR